MDSEGQVKHIALFSHADCSRHDTGWGHPEHQGRLRELMKTVDRALPDLAPHVEPIEGRPLDPERLLLVHGQNHVDRVERVVKRAAQLDEIIALDPDTVVSGASWKASLAAAGCVVDAVESITAGHHRAAFCAVRPPGHHATADLAMGFCLFNSVAIAARHAVTERLAEKVLIVDWDVHHGNGTQDIFYHDPSVFYLSMHQSPHYPGSGAPDERGAGEGEGTTLNVPLPPGLEPDRYVAELLGALDDALSRFAPDLVIISCGFDAAAEDPLAGFTLRPEHFRQLTLELVNRTAETTGRRVVSALEGGYNPSELGHNAVTHLLALRDATADPASGGE